MASITKLAPVERETVDHEVVEREVADRATEADTAPALTPEPPPIAPKKAPISRKTLVRRVLFALLPVAILAGGYFYVTGGTVMSTNNAYVQADMANVSTDVAGIVSQVMVRDNQQAAAGDVLFKLDDTPFRLSLSRAEAQLGTVRNDLLALRASYRNVQTQIAQAKADIDFATTTFKRQQQLAATSAASQASLDAARNALQGAQQKLASLEQQLAGIAATLGGDVDTPIESHPRYRDALAARDEAARQLAHTVVRAPFAGIVTNVPSLQPGQYLAAAAVAFNIVSTDHLWIQANPKETELTWVRPGQHVTIEVDAYPGRHWTGTVESISPASASSFSLLPAENSSGNWVKVVQRIPLRVRVDPAAGQPPLRVGMSVELSIETGHPRGVPDFLKELVASADNAADSGDD